MPKALSSAPTTAEATEIKNAVIESVLLTIEDHGLLTAWLQLSYGGTGQGFGGYALYLPKSFSHHKVNSVAGHFICRCMEVAGVSEWNKLQGRTIRVRADYNGVHSIGHIVKDDWFTPSVEFATKAASSPDLLEVCLLFARWAQAGQDFKYPPGSLQQLTEAIAKATEAA